MSRIRPLGPVSAICVGLCVLLALPADLFPYQQPQESPPAIRIIILEGDGAINNMRQRVNREPIVQVQDENHKPIAGAAVTFFLPTNGASGTFPDGSRNMTVMTDSNGRAVARGIRPNGVNGPMQIRVTAGFHGQTTSAVITQTNAISAAAASAAATGGFFSSKIFVIVLAATVGAAAGGAYWATHSGSSNPAAPPSISITAGTPSVGAPR